MSQADAVLGMYVAECFSFPARCEFEIRDIRAVIQNIAVPGDDPEAFSYQDVRSLQRRKLVARRHGKYVLTDDGRQLGAKLLGRHPRRRQAMSDGRFRFRGLPASLERFLRLSELLGLDAAQGRRSHWLGHGFSTTDVDTIADAAAREQESAVLSRLGPLWDRIERRWKLGWMSFSLALVAAEAAGVVMAFTGVRQWWIVLGLTMFVRTSGPFRGFRYMARLVHLLNPRAQGPPIQGPGYEPPSAFALYLREFKVERNQQLNALNARWRMDPYERRIGRTLRRRAVRLLGLVDPSRAEPPQFVQEVVAVADARWQVEVRRLVSRAAVVILDLRKHSLSPDSEITKSVDTERRIILSVGADGRTIGLGSRGLVAMPGGRMWHLQPQSLTVLDIALGLLVGVVLALVVGGGASWAIGYVAGRAHVASGATLAAWGHRFGTLVDRLLGATH